MMLVKPQKGIQHPKQPAGSGGCCTPLVPSESPLCRRQHPPASSAQLLGQGEAEGRPCLAKCPRCTAGAGLQSGLSRKQLDQSQRGRMGRGESSGREYRCAHGSPSLGGKWHFFVWQHRLALLDLG